MLKEKQRIIEKDIKSTDAKFFELTLTLFELTLSSRVSLFKCYPSDFWNSFNLNDLISGGKYLFKANYKDTRIASETYYSTVFA